MATKLIPPPEPKTKEEVPDGEGAVMGFFEHLDELRQHLFRAVLGLAVGMAIAMLFANQIITFIANSAITTTNVTLQSISPTENVSVYLRVVLATGAILVSPWITYQFLSFITPGMTRGEKKWLWRAIPATTILFLAGVLITWFLLMPAYVSWLAGFQATVIKPIWTADNYFSFVTQVVFWHGVAFETPIIFYVLARIGIVNANQMLKYWRHGLIGAACFAGFIAPTYDPVTMIVISGLLFGLYMFSVLLVIVAVPGSYTRPTKAS